MTVAACLAGAARLRVRPHIKEDLKSSQHGSVGANEHLPEVITKLGEDRPAVESLEVVADPSVLNFGKIKSRTEPLELKVGLRNLSRRSHEILKVTTGCGCTAVDPQREVIGPGERVELAVKINLQNRRGLFANQIYVKFSDIVQNLEIPIRGTVTEDFWVRDSSIRFEVGEGETTASKDFQIETDTWPTLQFDWNVSDQHLRVEEMSRQQTPQSTVINLRLLVELDENYGTSIKTLDLRPMQEGIASSTIPVVISRPRQLEALVAKTQASARLPPPTPVVGLGLITRGGAKAVRLRATPGSQGWSVASFEGFPSDAEVNCESQPFSVEGRSGTGIVLRIDIATGTRLGPFSGRIQLINADGAGYLIPIQGYVGPVTSGRHSPGDLAVQTLDPEMDINDFLKWK